VSESSIQLEYSMPQRRPNHAVVLGLLFALALVLIGGLGGVAGYNLTPSVWRVEKFYRVAAPPGPNVSAQAIDRSIVSHVAALQSPAALDAVIRDVQNQGYAVPSDEPGRTYLRNGLRIQAVPNSLILTIRFESPQGPLSHAIVRGFYDFALSNGGPPQNLGIATATPQRSYVGAVVGTLLGIGGVLAISLWVIKRRGGRDAIVPMASVAGA
jgi:hypothetical protein